MKILLELNLPEKTVSYNGGAWSPPPITFGEDLTLALRTVRSIDGATSPYHEEVLSLKASVGRIDAPPTGSKTCLQIGADPATSGNTTAAFPFNVTANALQGKINALTAVVNLYGLATVSLDEGSYVFSFAGGTAGAVEVPLQLRNNRLTPVSFGEFSAWQIDGQWLHSLRLVQAPVAFADAAPRILPPQPSIVRIQAGNTVDDFKINEIQELTVPAEFLGSYQLALSGKKSELLSRADGTEEIELALARINPGFLVTSPLPQKANIDFAGSMAGNPFDPEDEGLTVSVHNAPEGDLTFNLDLGKDELFVMLRGLPEMILPLEVRMEVLEDGVIKKLIAFRQNLAIRRPLIWPDMALVQGINWLLTPSPKSYRPFGLENVFTGQKYYAQTIGDGSATSFPIAHGRASDLSPTVAVSENARPGRLLRDNEYTATINSANLLTISGFASVPTSGQYTVSLTWPGTIASFAEGLTVTQDQVEGLVDYLGNFDDRLTTVEAILPVTGPAGTVAASSGGLEIELPEISKTLFLRNAEAGEFDATALSIRPPFLLQAVHDASIVNLPSTLPAPASGSVWQNVSGSFVAIPGGGQVPGSKVADQGFVASDGRLLYPAIRGGTSNSFYPAPFEQTLFTLEINDKMLRLNGTLDLRFALLAQLVNAGVQAQWIVVIEVGAITADTSPAPVGLNVQKITWSATPILAQRILLSELAVKHSFGARIKRALVSLADTLTADKMSYGVWEGANAGAPATANFALRARLTQFDTENIADPRGWLHYELLGAADGEGTNADKATATIIY